jgi:hypothetical protein
MTTGVRVAWYDEFGGRAKSRLSDRKVRRVQYSVKYFVL